MTNLLKILEKIKTLKILKILKILEILKKNKIENFENFENLEGSENENFEKLLDFGNLEKEGKIVNLDNSKLRIGQDDDELCNKILEKLNKKDKKILEKYKVNKNGILTGKASGKFLPIIPEIFQKIVLRAYHDNLLGGGHF